MLRKLLKHEFRATARVMLPLYLVVLITALGANFSVRALDSTANEFLQILSVLVLSAFVIAIIAVCIICLALMVQRFHKNLMGDEGYIMFTLPASVHKHVWSKLIVSAVWFAATAVVVALAILILFFDVAFVADAWKFLQHLLRQLNFYYAFNGTAIVMEALALCFLSAAVICLQFYAAMAIGHSFSGRKVLLSVVFYFALQFAMQIITSLVTVGPAAVFMQWVEDAMYGWPVRGDAMAAYHLTMGLSALSVTLHGAVYYFLTTFMLKNRLNLE